MVKKNIQVAINNAADAVIEVAEEVKELFDDDFDFAKALEYLKDGKKVTRPVNGTVTCFFKLEKANNSNAIMRYTGDVKEQLEFAVDDLLAKDWVLVD